MNDEFKISVPKSRRPVAVDLFAGAGGFSLGMEQAGFDVLVAVEYDSVHACTYAFNFPLTKVICDDVSYLSVEVIKKAAYQGFLRHYKYEHKTNKTNKTNKIIIPNWDGKIDVVFGGPPCQGFSVMGKREITDTRNSLIFEFYRLIIELNPRYFVMENVPGIANKNNFPLLSTLISKFEAAGYSVEKHILNAVDFGVPQKRQRLFLIGNRIGKENILTNTKANQEEIKVKVKDAIADLPNIDNFPQLQHTDEILLSLYQRKAQEDKCSLYARILRSNPLNKHFSTPPNFSYPRLWNPYLLTCSMQTQHRESSKIRFGQTIPGELEKISRFRRLKLDGFSHTLRAGTDKNRGRHTSPRPIHPTLPRVISVREAARLHSFPDWFRFHQTKWHGFRQVGNSVPPLLAQAIGEDIINSLQIKPYKYENFLSLGSVQLLRFSPFQAESYWKKQIFEGEL
ncbi:MAG: DNA cytosine methyltransferase [Cyanobacteria bacterium P01_A01_bin.84]